MSPDLLLLPLPVLLYVGLVMIPPPRGGPASLAALGFAGVFLLASAGAPREAYFSLDREVRALYAGALTGAAAGAVAYHRLSRGGRAGWLWRVAGLAIGVLAAVLIGMALVRVL